MRRRVPTDLPSSVLILIGEDLMARGPVRAAAGPATRMLAPAPQHRT